MDEFICKLNLQFPNMKKLSLGTFTMLLFTMGLTVFKRILKMLV